MGPFDDLIPAQNRRPSAPPMLGQPLAGPPRQPTPRFPDETALGQNRAAASAYDAQIAQANAAKAAAEAHSAEIAAQSGNEVQQQQRIRHGNIDAASEQLLRVGRMYREQYQPNTYGPISSIAETVNLGPLTPTNQAFNSAAQGLVDAGMPVFRTPGVGSQSNLEGEWFNNANRLRASNSDQNNEAILDNLQIRLNAQRAQLGLPPLDWRGDQQDQQPNAAQASAAAHAQAGGAMPGGPAPGGPPTGSGAPGGGTPPQGMDRTSQTMVDPSQTGRQLGDGSTRLEEDPVLRGVAHRIGAMVARGAPDDQVIQFLRQAGVDPAGTNIQGVLEYRRTPAFRQWQSHHPHAAYPIDNTFYTRQVPQTGVRRTMASIANSPAGAYAANAGDAVTFGTLDNMTNDPTQARAGMEALRGSYPMASIAGTVSGSALGAGALEGGAAQVGARGLWAARGADALYGGAYGAGSADDGSRALGALEGAATSMGSGAAGRLVQRGAGRVMTGARDATTQFLTDRGIPLTLGQMAGRGGVLGRAVRGMEDKLQSVPLLGDAIRARREAGVQSFNRAAFDEALAPIGQTTAGTIAEEGVDTMRGARSGAYSQALSGVQLNANDPVFIRDMSRVINTGRRLPGSMADEFAYTITNRVAPELENGVLTGEGYQAIRQGLRQDVAAMRGQPRGHDFARAVRQAEGALEAMVRRQAPQVVPDLNRADQAYARSRVVENAVAAGQNTGGVFTPAQLGQSARANARRFGGNQATTQRPFYELQRAGQDVLPSTVPNSGTADRAMAAALIPAAAGVAGYETDFLSPQTASMLAAFGLPYTRAGQQTLQTLIARRPDLLRRMGEGVIRNQRVGGTLARGAGIPMLPNYSGQ